MPSSTRMLLTTSRKLFHAGVGRNGGAFRSSGALQAGVCSRGACCFVDVVRDPTTTIGWTQQGTTSYGTTIRFFSAAAPDPQKKKDDDDSEQEGGNIISRTFKSVLTPQNQFYLLVAGGSIGAYGISRIFLGFTNFFTHLTPTVIAKWGFYTGFGCATIVGGLALITADNLYIRADPVYKYCLNWVQSDTFLQQTLGDGIQPGSLRSYRLDSGKMEIVGRSAIWRPPRIQMIFDITATGPPYRTGIVTCEAIKSGGFPPQLITNLLKVDYELGNEGEAGGTREDDQTYFLKGSQEDFSRVSKRSGLSLDMLARSIHIEKAAAGRQQEET